MSLVKTLFSALQKPSDTFSDQLFMHSPVPTIVTDENQVLVMVNSAFSRLSGYTSKELLGENTSLFKTGRHDHLFYEERRKKLTATGFYEGEVWSRCQDQSERLLLEKIQRIEHHSKIYYLCILEDVTESRKQVERYRYLAMHDALTGLANRSLAIDRFNHALLNSVRAGEKLGVLLCDLNEFKQVNDLYGHHVGDMLLIEIGKKLTSLVREGDTVARIGGDEFLIIIERLQREDELDHLVQKIQKQLQTSFEIEGQIIDARVSIGDACSPQDGLTYENLLKIADHKMYRDKERYYGFA
jgi:diguanylate cyclase (GGDEF)-like protein/PAS domain S-box-containing protein